MSVDAVRKHLPCPSTMGLLTGIIILISGALYFALLLPKENTFFDLKDKIAETCKYAKPAEAETCRDVETMEWTMYDRILVFKESATLWGRVRACIIFSVVVSGVITSIYIANSTGKGETEVSAMLKSAGAAAAFLTPTLLGLYGAFNISSKPEELRNTALLLSEINNTFLINRCRLHNKVDGREFQDKTKYCEITAEEESLFQKFAENSFSGFNILNKIDEKQLNRSTDSADKKTAGIQ